MNRAKAYTLLTSLVIALLVFTVTRHYVDQQRYLTVGFCPPGVAGDGPSIMLYDSRRPTIYCLPVPQVDKSLLAPHPPAREKTPA